jgi:hypothetical protein
VVEEDIWFLKGMAFAFLTKIAQIEQLPNENSLKNAKSMDISMTKKDAKHFIDIIAGL